MVRANDYGHDALAGFLFQTLGSASLAAELLGQPSDTDDGISATFAIVKLESQGQDAELVSTDDGEQRARKFVQFKYSGDPAKYQIEPHELIAILESFRESVTRANDVEVLASTFSLVSNRQLTASAQSLVEACKNDQACDQLDAVEERTNGATKNKGRTKANNAKYRLILKRLSIEPVDEAGYLRTIAERARAFGMLDTELHAGVNRLVVAFFQRAASINRRITATELDEQLMDFAAPRRLTDHAIRQVLLNDIAGMKGRLQFPKRELLPRRELVQHPLFSSRALVIVCGDGGTGKSVAACQIVEAALELAPQSPPPFVAMDSVRDLVESWVGGLVSGWRNSPQPAHRGEPADTAIRRLAVATSGVPPILLLALDGIDEIGLGPEHRAVRLLLRFFHDEDMRCQAERSTPRAVLLVTCRHPEEIYGEWISLAGFRPRVDGANCLHLNNFSNAEICQLADGTLAQEIASRIRRTAALADPVIQCELPVENVLSRVADPEVFAAIKHPGLWRLFSEDLGDPDEQHSALDGDPAAVGKLCQLFLDWLCWKAEHRRNSIPADETRLALRAVASRFGDPGRAADLVEGWNHPILSAGCSALLAQPLFREASSLGLIVKLTDTSWKWRHSFMCRYLADLQT